MWSKLPLDVLTSVLGRLSFVDFQHSKMVCWNWYSASKHTVPRKSGSPWLILFLDDGGCSLYNPDEERIYRSLGNFSGIRFLANSGNWFLVLDSLSNLYIIDLFSENRIDLPPIESLQTNTFTIKRSEDNKDFITERDSRVCTLKANDLRGILWVDEKTKEYVVVWFFDALPCYLSFCKKGDDHYSFILLYDPLSVPKLFIDIIDVVLLGYRLYILNTPTCLRVIDFSGQQGFQEITDMNQSYDLEGGIVVCGIVVTECGEVLLVGSLSRKRGRCFCLYKKDPNEDVYTSNILKIYSLGDKALLLDSGITVMANHSLGIEPNSIYFTRYPRAIIESSHSFDICVFNLATKTIKRFPSLNNINFKDARWFLPMT